uniref:Origin recognition complex subunit 4 n=1 Tax=Aegilops tauschii subsp. strangulata TaxID=200361 RepID=A0A453FCT3_AEGTS
CFMLSYEFLFLVFHRGLLQSWLRHCQQLTPMAAAPVASQAQAVLRGRLCDPAFVHSRLRSSPDTNYSKLKYLVSSSVSEACNNSVLLLGPRGCGKGAVLDMVLEDLKEEHPDAISVIRLNGMLHSDDNCATK